jgi:hypothetical protein
MFRALLGHIQQALHKQQVVYFVHVMSVGCYQVMEEMCQIYFGPQATGI